MLLSGHTDAVVVLLPEAALGDGITGRLLAALVAAGAFAAFLSTSSGLLTSVAGVISTDVLGPRLGPRLPRATVIAGLVPLLLALFVSGLDVSQVVGLAFAVAASSFCPLLVLGIWWRGLTDWAPPPGWWPAAARRSARASRHARPAAVRLAGVADRPAGRLDGAFGLYSDGFGVDGDIAVSPPTSQRSCFGNTPPTPSACRKKPCGGGLRPALDRV